MDQFDGTRAFQQHVLGQVDFAHPAGTQPTPQSILAETPRFKRLTAQGTDRMDAKQRREDGQILWDFDTAREFKTVNGIPGHGGSIDGPGAVVVKGMVYVNSGYSRQSGMPGNVLLAFGVTEP